MVEEPGWTTRGNRWNVDGKPEGVMQHHTSLPNPYPIKKLYGPLFYRIKANMATHEDGTLYLIAYKACNYSSGPGSSVVLNNVRKSVAPWANARTRGLTDDMGGNRHFWNYENSHPGDGSPIPQVQLDTIIESTRVVLDYFGLNAEQVISHAEWTKRKIVPRWNGSNRTAIEQIRTLLGEDDMAVMDDETQQFWTDVKKELDKLNPATNASWGKTLVEHVRNHPAGGGGLTETDGDARYVRKGAPVVIKGTS